jgi:integrase
MHLIVTLLYGAGLRLEECLALRIEDIDFEREQIVVQLDDVRRMHASDTATDMGGWCCHLPWRASTHRR